MSQQKDFLVSGGLFIALCLGVHVCACVCARACVWKVVRGEVMTLNHCHRVRVRVLYTQTQTHKELPPVSMHLPP